MYLSEINIYPIKSLGGISLNEAQIERRGLELDRRWMLIDENNNFLTQRELPKMATLVPEILKEGLQISDGAETFLVPFEPESSRIETVKVWSTRTKGKIYEDSVNKFFSDALQIKCRLTLMPEETHRRVSSFYAVHKDDHVSFADAYPFLLIGESSLEDLNGRLEKSVPMNRFRPNLVVAGAEPFAEDSWKRIRVGEDIFYSVKPCARCVMTTIDQSTGEKQGKEPLKTLASYRIPKRSIKKKILFGQNLIAEKAGAVLRVGDEIEVLETKRSPVF